MKFTPSKFVLFFEFTVNSPYSDAPRGDFIEAQIHYIELEEVSLYGKLTVVP
jgi:hypothetical protein